MQPVRKVLAATHFKPVTVTEPTQPNSTVTKWTPCSPGDSVAVEKTWSDVAGSDLLEPSLVYADFLRAVKAARPTVKDEDVIRYREFTNESGADGA